MKKFTLLIAMLLTFVWQGHAQYGCGSAVVLSDGYTAMGITTPGTSGTEDWNENPTGTSINSSYWDDDVYLFEYTAGATTELISMSVFTRNNWNGVGIFDDCTGTTFSNELDASASSSSSNFTHTVSATIASGNTVYIAVGQWGTPNGVDIDVTDFSVTAITCPSPTALEASNITAVSAELSWTPGDAETVWNIEIAEAGAATGTATATGVTNPYNASALTAGTDYEFWVQSDCGGEVSAWEGPHTFSTANLLNCGDNFYDTGGDAANYSSNENETWIVYPTDPAEFVEIKFNMVDLEGDYDYLRIYEGDSESAVEISGAEGVIAPGIFTSTTAGEPLKITFSSDGGAQYAGWAAVVSCVTCVAPNSLSAANITTTTADLNWTAGGSETSWNVEIVDTETAPTGTATDTGVTNSFTATGLNSNTSYEYYVQADCGSGDLSSWAGPFGFITPCDFFTAPYSENFDDDAGLIPMCWSNDSSTERVWEFDTEPSSSNNYVDHTTGTGYLAYVDGSTSDVSTDATLTTPFIDVSTLTTPMLEFFVYHFEDQTTDDSNTITVEVWDGAAWNQVYFDDSGDVEAWEQIQIDLSTLTITGNVQARFIVDTEIGSNFYNDIGIDDVSFDEFPSCLNPTDLAVTNITANSANLSWVAGDSETVWNIEIVEAGVAATGTATATGVTNPYTASTLLPITAYEFYVQADCGTEVSEWVGPYAFTTLCDIYVPDYSQNFDTFVPDCWEEASSGTPATGPSDLGSGSWLADEFLNTGINMAVNVNLYSTGKEEWLISPNFDLSGGVYELAYMVATTDYNNSDPIEGGTMGSDDEVQVLISEDDGATWTNLMTYNAANTPSNTGDFDIIDLSSYTGTVKFAFWASEGTVDDAAGVYDYDFFVDDFTVRTPPACLQPTDLTADAITSSSANLSWTAGEDETAWNIEILAAGDTPTGTGTPMTANSFTATTTTTGTAFTANTSYEFYVQADCGGGNLSTWTGPFAFTTACEIVTTPFTEGFETTAEDEVTDCWTIINNGGSDAWYVNDVATDAFEGSQVMYISWDSDAHDDYLITPQISVTAGSTDRFSFRSSGDSGSYTETFNVLVSTTGSNAADFTQIDGPVTAPQTGWNEHVYNLSAYAGQNIYIAIQVISQNQLHLYIDGVVLDALPACPEPTALTADVTHNSASISWTAGDTETSWNYVWQLAGTGTPVDGDGTAITTASYEATGLESETDYEFWVQADCGDGLSMWVGPLAITTLLTPPVNDNLANATALTLNASCSGDMYTNEGATVETGEIGGDCFYSDTVDNSVWFSFVAPPTGAVTVTTDIAPGDLSDSEIAVYAAPTDVNDLSTLAAPIGCDQDGGDIVGFGYMSMLELTGLTAGATYYVQVDGYDAADGDFCIEVNYETCAAPTDVTVSNITTNTADFTWTAGDTEIAWNVEIVEAGTAPTGVPTATDVANPYLATGLSSETDYEFYVQSICGTDNLSEWIGPLEFSTSIEPVEVSLDAPVMNSTYCYTSSDIKEWMFVSADGAPLSITFNAGTLEDTPSGETYDDLLIYDGTDDTGVLLFNSDIDGFVMDGLTFTAMSGNIYMYLDSDSSVSCESDTDIVALDFNVEVMECNTPTNLVVTAIDSDIQLTWDEVSSAIGYEYFVVLEGEDPIVDNYVTSGSTSSGQEVSVLISEIDTGVDYDIYLSAICATDFNSENSMINYAAMSVQDNTIDGFSYYPNPVENTLNIKALENIKAYKVYNMLGQIIMSKTPENLSSEVDMSNLQSGAYILSVTVGNKTGTYRIIKK